MSESNKKVCSACGRDLWRRSAKLESPIDAAEVYILEKLYCNNPKCVMFRKTINMKSLWVDKED
ncbi:MAG: hypothetical protein HPY74_19900 [Firmicutes bacterium]|nr:hypothetical protein [Bacillota bacterium]